MNKVLNEEIDKTTPVFDESARKYIKDGYYLRFSKRKTLDFPSKKLPWEKMNLMNSGRTPVGQYGWDLGVKKWASQAESLAAGSSTDFPFGNRQYIHVFKLKSGSKVITLNTAPEVPLVVAIAAIKKEKEFFEVGTENTAAYKKILEKTIKFGDERNDFPVMIHFCKALVEVEREKEENKDIARLNKYDYMREIFTRKKKALKQQGVPYTPEELVLILKYQLEMTLDVVARAGASGTKGKMDFKRFYNMFAFLSHGQKFTLTDVLLSLGIDAIKDSDASHEFGEYGFQLIYSEEEKGQIAVVNPNAIEYVATYQNPAIVSRFG